MQRLSPNPDELHRTIGAPHPELYGQALLTWGGLGDLKHDSDDPTRQAADPNQPLPLLEKFLVLQENTFRAEGYFHKMVSEFTTSLSMASWNHETTDHTERISRERRALVQLDYRFAHRTQSFRSTSEFILGRNGVIFTEVWKHGEDQGIYCQRFVPAEIASRVIELLRTAPNSEVVEQAKKKKREAISRSHDLSRALHDLEVADVSGGKLLLSDGRDTNQVTEHAMRMSEIANSNRLTRISPANRLFDAFGRRVGMASQAMLGGASISKH